MKAPRRCPHCNAKKAKDYSTFRNYTCGSGWDFKQGRVVGRGTNCFYQLNKPTFPIWAQFLLILLPYFFLVGWTISKFLEIMRWR